jgi:hypothetical protein
VSPLDFELRCVGRTQMAKSERDHVSANPRADLSDEELGAAWEEILLTNGFRRLRRGVPNSTWERMGRDYKSLGDRSTT